MTFWGVLRANTRILLRPMTIGHEESDAMFNEDPQTEDKRWVKKIDPRCKAGRWFRKVTLGHRKPRCTSHSLASALLPRESLLFLFKKANARLDEDCWPSDAIPTDVHTVAHRAARLDDG